jgi:hypothetical protein
MLTTVLIMCTIGLSHYPGERGIHEVGHYSSREYCEKAGANFKRGGLHRSFWCDCGDIGTDAPGLVSGARR